MSFENVTFAEIVESNFNDTLTTMIEILSGKLDHLEEHEKYADSNSLPVCDGTDFDSYVDSFLDEHYPEKDLEDSIMLREEINNYSDSMCKDGIISDLMYNQYVYGGRFVRYT